VLNGGRIRAGFGEGEGEGGVSSGVVGGAGALAEGLAEIGPVLDGVAIYGDEAHAAVEIQFFDGGVGFMLALWFENLG